VSETLTEETLVELMPELKGLDLTIDELKGGITNKLYRVQSSNGGDFVVRFYGQNTELFIDREVEMENLRRMASTGIAPKLVRYLPDWNVTVVEFIPGYVLKNEDFLKRDLWKKIVRPIRIVHQSGATLPRRFDPLHEVKGLYALLNRLNADYLEFDIDQTIATLEKISRYARVPLDRFVPCHNDLLADNFILVENQEKYTESICLIDWEYAGMSTPYYDIADMFQEILVPRNVEREILRVYWEDKDLDHHIAMTDLFKPFPDIYWFLWSLIQRNISTIDFDYYNYGKVKYENAQSNIQYLKETYGVPL
jgi:thiamine kinase-like enzyme